MSGQAEHVYAATDESDRMRTTLTEEALHLATTYLFINARLRLPHTTYLFSNARPRLSLTTYLFSNAKIVLPLDKG